MNTRSFRNTVWKYYKTHRRNLPWRTPALRERKDGTLVSYKVLVSEVMLQQTQAARVIPKYTAFLKRFPNFKTLARAPLKEVLKAWQGLGYNRRAKHLKQAAEIVMREYGGKLPHTAKVLARLPGIGPYTAGAILAFAYNRPAVFVETNIRAVFIHHFFPGKKKVDDRELLPLIEKTLPAQNRRDWYSALMDYGAYLKQTAGNPNTRSRHYTKQTPFKGSHRQLRGLILKLLLETPHTEGTLTKTLTKNKKDVQKALRELESEKLIVKKKSHYTIA